MMTLGGGGLWEVIRESEGKAPMNGMSAIAKEPREIPGS